MTTYHKQDEILENSPIFNNVFVIGIYDKWEVKFGYDINLKNISDIDKKILYLFFEKIVFEKYPNTKDGDEIPIIFNIVLRIVRLNKNECVKFKNKIYERIKYFIHLKELENDFDFNKTLSDEFDDVLKYLEIEYKKFESTLLKKEDLPYVPIEQIAEEASYLFMDLIKYPN